MPHNRRTARGSFMPNIFFLLQVGVIFLALFIGLQVAAFFSFPTIVTYAMYGVTIAAIIYCIVARVNILERQFERYRKNKG